MRNRLRSWMILAAVAVLALTGRTQIPQFTSIHRSLPAYLLEVQDFALGDLDGDGDVDAIAGTNGADVLLLNDGRGYFVEAPVGSYPTDSQRTSDLQLADLDGDGDLDVLTVGGVFTIYTNDGSGVFTDESAALINGSYPLFPNTLTVGDVDGDGDPDVVIGHGGPNSDQLWQNQGGGMLTVSSTFPIDSQATFASAMVDVDSDGDLDVLLGGLSEAVRLYQNDGFGGFSDISLAALPQATSRTRGIYPADVDGDGDSDLILVRSGSLPDACLINDGTGQFVDETAARFPNVANPTFGGVAADFDDDGDVDFLTAEFDDYGRLLRNDGSGVFTDVAGALPASARVRILGVAAADLDGDGDPDVLAADDTRGPELWFNDGLGTFEDGNRPDLDIFNISSGSNAVFADFDGDGDLDLAVANGQPFSQRRNALLLHEEDGTFTEVTTSALPAVTDATLAVAAGDVDGDGDVDLLFGNWSSASSVAEDTRLLRNDGSAHFTQVGQSTFPFLGVDCEDIALADFDGDGDLDAWIATFGGLDQMLVNDGSGSFSRENARLPAVNGSVRHVALGDIDGDGDLDALTAVASTQNRVFENDGTGFFADITASAAPVSSTPSLDAEFGDLDGDGDLDAWIVEDGIEDVVWRNDGLGGFTQMPATAVAADTIDTRSVELTDFDQDGDLDAVLTIAGRGVATAVNDGTGTFTVVHASEPFSEIRRAVLGDADGDGLEDLVVLGNWLSEYQRNDLRRLSHRGLPRVGKRTILDLEAALAVAGVVNVGLAPARIPTAFGPLRLDPTLVGGALLVTLAPTGRAEVTLDVPDLPSLIGVSLYWQAVLLEPAGIRFSNLEATRLRGA